MMIDCKLCGKKVTRTVDKRGDHVGYVCLHCFVEYNLEKNKRLNYEA